MKRTIERIDAWCRSGDFTVEDLARYRIIYGVIALVTLPGLGAIAAQPEAQFDPPPGPIMLFDSIPSRGALEALELVIAVLIGFLIIGFKTKATSLLLALAMMTGSGLSYSFGKIDHPVFVLLVPLVMAFSGWGGAMSVDASLAARSGRPRTEASQWAMRLLAFMMGLAFFTAGSAKLRSGWLDLDTQAVRGHFLSGYVIHDRNQLLAPLVLRVEEFSIVWEALDWFTVALECGLVIAVLWWRTFRIGIAVASLFHFGVLMMMNIQFSANVIAYGAFVRWNLFRPTPPGRVLRLSSPVAAVVGLALGAVAYGVHNSDLERFLPSIGLEVLVVGAVFATVYLIAQAVQVIKAMRRRSRTPGSRTPTAA